MQSTHNTHHLLWPRKDYKTPVERKFRELACNKTRMLIEDHRELHHTTGPPAKPKLSHMRWVLELHDLRKCPTCHGGD